MGLLGFASLVAEGEMLWFIFFSGDQKPKCFTFFFGVFAVVHVVSVDHSLEIPAFAGEPPFHALMNEDIVEDEIKNAIGQDPQRGAE